MAKRILQETILDSEFAQAAESSVVDLDRASSYCIFNKLVVSTPAAKEFVAGVLEVQTITCAAKAAAVDGDYLVLEDTTGAKWAIAIDKTGSSAEPTGAIWAAIPAANKAQVDISATTDNVSVAAAVEAAINGLTDVPFTADDTAADGTLTVTQSVRGPVADPVAKKKDDSASGTTVTGEQTTEGVASTVDVEANTITIASHGLKTGLKGQLTTSAGSLPGALSAATDYWVIVVNSSTIKLATSLANANAGTAVNITNQGTAASTFTFTPTSIAGATAKLQMSIDRTNWVDVASSSQNITATGNLYWTKVDPEYRYLKVVHTMTAGQVDAECSVLLKG